MVELSDILKAALRLEVQDRAALAEQLLASLDQLTQEETERLWAEEAQRRLEQYRAGNAQGIPADSVHEKAERFFR